MFLYLYSFAYRCALFLAQGIALFNPQIKVFLEQRSQWKSSLKKVTPLSEEKKVFWFHTASLGEFEQARPLIEKYRKHYPKAFIALTFFSASGYAIQKDYTHADWVDYLPLDRKKDLNPFLKRLQPNALFLVKYEFWPQLIFSLKQKNIPIYSISSIFRTEQLFFKPWHFGLRRVIKAIDHFYVQNKTSAALLQSIGIEQVTLSGDTRFDRVLQIAEQEIDLPKINAFVKNQFCFVAGSSWPEDHEMILGPLQSEKIKIIIAPHKIDEETLGAIEKKLVLPYVRWSQFKETDSEKKVLIIDCIGLLTQIYAYADAAYVGGGLGHRGLHNTLEPAVFGIPIIIGPHYKKFDEAIALTENKGTFSVHNSIEFEQTLKEIVRSKEQAKKIGQRNKAVVENRAGAVELIFSSLNQK